MPAEKKPSATASRIAARAIDVSRLWWWAPLVFAAAYLVTLATQFNRLLADIYQNADAASAPVIGELFGERSAHSEVILGHLGWYSTLLFEIGTRWMPLHRQIWEGAPYAMALCSAAFMGWGAWRVAGRWAGAVSAAIIVCAGPSALSLLFVLNDHAPTWFTLALLGAFLLWLEQRAAAISNAWLVAAAAVVGVLLGINAASDVLLTIAGGLPFVLAAGCVWMLHPGRQAARAGRVALGTVVIAIVSGVLLHSYMHHKSVLSAPDPRTSMLVGSEAVGTNFRFWWESIASLGNGDFFGQTLGFSTALALACAALTIFAILLTPRIARGEIARGLATRDSAHEPEQIGRLVWCVYWASSLVLLSAAFLLSGIPEGLASDRYLVGVIYAAAALVPLLGRHGPMTRAAITVGATLYAFTGWLALAQQRIGSPSSPNDQLASAVSKIASEEHLSIGYAGYWDAAPITWATHLHVKVFPVDDCDGDQHLCAYELHLITSWYAPRRGVKTFLLSDATYPAVPSAPTPDLGAPIATHQIGTVTMYVYPYDIAGHLFAL